jgi:methyl-accepting chemotaxis protein
VKLRTKIILPAVLLVLIGMGINIGITWVKSTSALSGMALENAKSSVSSLVSMTEMWVSAIKNEVVTLSHFEGVRTMAVEAAGGSPSPEKVTILFQDVIRRHQGLDNVAILDASGKVVAAAEQDLVGKNLGDRGYFQSTMKGEVTISKPVISVNKGQPVFTVCAPVRSAGKVVGVILAGVSLTIFSEQFIDPLNTESGQSYLLDPDGLVLAHPDKKLQAKFNVLKETDFGKKMFERDAGVLDVLSMGKEKLIIFEKVKSLGWVAGRNVVKEVVFAEATSLGRSILIFSAGFVVVLLAGLWIIVARIVLKPVRSLEEAAGRIAGGDLGLDLKTDRADEIGGLQKSLAHMVGRLKEIIREVEVKEADAAREAETAKKATAEAEAAKLQAERAKAQGMLQAASGLEGVVEVATSASEELSAQIEQSSRGAEEQSRRVGETATAMEEMNATVLEVARNASQASLTSDSARNKAQDGASIVGQVVNGIGAVQKQALALKEDMEVLGKQAEGIGQVMNVISDIADQTNLLALNAAIEAARAGDAGRGFAVVADEVRKLAEKTMNATKEVGEAIRGIQEGTRKNMDNVDRTARTIEETTHLARKSGDTLTEIVSMVDQASDQVRSIATASEEQSSASEEINRSIEQVATISTQTAQSMNQAAQAVSELARQTQVLQGLISTMKSEAGEV